MPVIDDQKMHLGALELVDKYLIISLSRICLPCHDLGLRETNWYCLVLKKVDHGGGCGETSWLVMVRMGLLLQPPIWRAQSSRGFLPLSPTATRYRCRIWTISDRTL